MPPCCVLGTNTADIRRITHSRHGETMAEQFEIVVIGAWPRGNVAANATAVQAYVRQQLPGLESG